MGVSKGGSKTVTGIDDVVIRPTKGDGEWSWQGGKR